MQTINVIIGWPNEGKTEELIDAFISYWKSDVGVVCETGTSQFISNTKLVKPYYITCEESLDVIYTRIIEKNSGIDSGYLIEIDNAKELISFIKDKLKVSDCIFFIDMPNLIMKDFEVAINTLIDRYPNNECKHGFDVVYTRSRKVSMMKG